MSEEHAGDTTSRSNLIVDASIWKKLGVTQAFDLLLVKACLQHADTAAALRERIGETLAPGAQKFWAMSFDELARNLRRKSVLDMVDEKLQLHADFLEKLHRCVDGFENERSRIVLQDGVRLEDIEARAQAREERARRLAAQKTASKGLKKRVARSADGGVVPSPAVKPAKRATSVDTLLGSDDLVASQPLVENPSTHSTHQSVKKKLFTSMRVDKLLDRLDNSTLSKPQLAERLNLHGAALERFLSVCEKRELIRYARTDLVELHWRGRELARTTDVERRMSVLELVKELRAADLESEVEVTP